MARIPQPSPIQERIENYILNRFGYLGIRVTSRTRPTSTTQHSPHKESATDFGFGSSSSLSPKKRLEILGSIFKTLYLEKPFAPLKMGLGLGIVTGNIHLHVDLRDAQADSFFFETKEGIVSEYSKPAEFRKLYNRLEGRTLSPEYPFNWSQWVLPLVLGGFVAVNLMFKPSRKK